ncbi:hypothetical protein HHK36_013695 [Tetracentron sinense]|uniref:DEUBAD domain-containing protein n=1 Tax=Tetracentron sinense TaxID=13715 RepID=A0A835DGZ2_TETSI|nr:hypothetical protein HHK36_013695 [Tetracentron sinense]
MVKPSYPLVYIFLFSLSLWVDSANGRNGSVESKVMVPVGVVIDLNSTVGKIANISISMALSDFYAAHAHYKTRMVLYTRDSKKDVVGAASTGALRVRNRVSRLDGEFSLGSRDSMSTDEEKLERQSYASESDEDDDADSGADSDDFDLSDLGESVLTLDAWNDCLTEEERFSLSECLPGMDQDILMRTLKEIISGSNFHFGSPFVKLFDMLKGALCEPRAVLYQQGLNFFQKSRHYHFLWEYQNYMVISLTEIMDAWRNCQGYSIEETLRVLNIMRSQRSLMYEKMEDSGLESDSEREELAEGLWGKKLNKIKHGAKMGNHAVYTASPTFDVPSKGGPMSLELVKYGKQNPKGILKISGSKVASTKELMGCFPSIKHGLETKSRSYGLKLALPRQDRVAGYDSRITNHKRGRIRGEHDAEESTYEMALQRDRNGARSSAMTKMGC